MKEKITTKDYIFTLTKDGVIVKYIYDTSLKDINLSKINIEMVGIMPFADKNKPWVVSIISKESIHKLQMQITPTLDVVGFHFDNYTTAVSVQALILQSMSEQK